MKITFDLSTLNLSDGSHNIEIKAKGTGWEDSEASPAVVYNTKQIPNANIELDGDILTIYDESGLATSATLYVDGVAVQTIEINLLPDTEVTVDLSTLNLIEGEYIITVKLSADGHETSSFSNEVIYTVRPNMTTEANATGITVKFRNYSTTQNENGTTVIIK